MIRRRFVPGGDNGDLAERMMKSGMWMLAVNILDRVLKVVMFIVFARPFGPEAIGLVDIALLIIPTLLSLANLGIDAMSIQYVDDDMDGYLNATLTLEPLRDPLMSSILYLTTPSLTSLLGEPAAWDLIRAIALVPILLALWNLAVTYFKKDLAFHKELAYRVSGMTAYVVVTLGHVAVSPTVWALISGYLVDVGVRSVATYFLRLCRPRPALNHAYAAELIGYGKWVTESSIVEFLYKQGNGAAVGQLLTATSFGYYQLTYRISNASVTETAVAASSVMFSIYSKL